jgi:hypothetical protein
MRYSGGISFREISSLENERLENKLHESTQRNRPHRENRLLTILVMVMALLLIAIGGTLLFTAGAMTWLRVV